MTMWNGRTIHYGITAALTGVSLASSAPLHRHTFCDEPSVGKPLWADTTISGLVRFLDMASMRVVMSGECSRQG